MILSVGCEYEPVGEWAAILPTPTAPSNYKKQEAIDAYVAKQVQKLADGEAAHHPVTGIISHAVILDEKGKSVYDEEGEHTGGGALLVLSEHMETRDVFGIGPIFGLKLHRMLRLMAFDLAMTEDEVPTKAQWALDLDPTRRYNRDYLDPISVLFGSSDVDPWAIARRTGYVFGARQGLDTARGMAKFALALGGMLGLGG